MKICFVLPQYHHSTDQHYFHLYELIEKLAQNHQVFVFAEAGQDPITIKGLAGSHVQQPSFLPFRLLERLLFFTKLRYQGFTTFYCHYAETSAILAASITRIFGGHTFKWLCSQEHLYQKPWSIANLKDKLVRELPLILSLKLIHHLVTCTPHMKRYYHHHFGIPLDKIKVIPNFVCLNRFKPYTGDKHQLKRKLNLSQKPLLLFVHRLSPRKGADRLIPLAQEIHDRKLNLHILAIGDGPLLAKLTKLRTKHYLQDQLTLLGPIPNAHITPYFQAADIFIMPSRVEEFGRVQLEAMASGLPVIVTQTNSSPFVLKKYPQQFILPQTRFREIASVAGDLIQKKARYRQLVHLVLSRTKVFSLSQAKYNFELLFQSK